MKRRITILGLAVLIVMLCGATVWWVTSSRITERNWKRIELGMSRSQVERILGAPLWEGPGPVLSWSSEHGSIDVVLDAKEVVVLTHWNKGRRVTPWERVLEWFEGWTRPRIGGIAASEQRSTQCNGTTCVEQ